MATLLKYLRDPAWKAIGVLVAVIALFMSASTSAPNRAELSIVHLRNVKFSDYWLPAERVKLLIEGATQDLENVQLDYFLLINSSQRPIVATDITSPIEITKGSGTKQLIVVESCSKQMAQACLPGGSSGGVGDPYVAFDWNAAGEGTWIAQPGLLNPREESCVLLISEKSAGQLEDAGKRFSWGGRIVDVGLKTYASYAQYVDRRTTHLPYYLWVVVLLQGVGIYWFLTLQAVLFAVFVYLGVQAQWISPVPVSHVFRLLLIAFLSITSAEIYSRA